MWQLRRGDVVWTCVRRRACGAENRQKFLDSTITQTIYLYEDSRRIDVENIIDWKQEHILLKAAFPTTIHTAQATYDIQFGHVSRTHEYAVGPRQIRGMRA